ncbi:MAG: leucyl/phenylalanyl-tRNA--protein transferase [Pseudomonadota bacterium]
MIPRLGNEPGAPFPPPDTALDEPDGLLAWGGDLSTERLLVAYRQGIFPWYSDDEPPLWWCPAQRCVIPTNQVHVARRLARLLRQGRFALTADRAFDAVVEACAATRAATWITRDMATAYARLHELGHAHSIEAWQDGTLVGGLYGVSIGRMFFGESMFSLRTDASKVILAQLCPVLHYWGFPLLDGQVASAHLFRMGAQLMPRARFLEEVGRLTQLPGPAGNWTAAFNASLSAGGQAPARTVTPP